MASIWQVPDDDKVNETPASEVETPRGNKSQEAENDIEGDEADAGAHAEEVSYT